MYHLIIFTCLPSFLLTIAYMLPLPQMSRPALLLLIMAPSLFSSHAKTATFVLHLISLNSHCFLHHQLHECMHKTAAISSPHPTLTHTTEGLLISSPFSISPSARTPPALPPHLLPPSAAPPPK